MLFVLVGCYTHPRAAYYGWAESSYDYTVLPGPRETSHPLVEERFQGNGAVYALAEPLLVDPFLLEVEVQALWGDEVVVLPLRTCREPETFCQAHYSAPENALVLTDLDPDGSETVFVRYRSRLERF